MLRIFGMVGAAAIAWAATAAAQDRTTAPTLSGGRLRSVADRWTAPEVLPAKMKRALDATVTAIGQGNTDTAIAHWREFLTQREKLATPFDPELYVDHVLAGVAASRNDAAREACRKVRFYGAQENAVFEHVSTVDKAISAYAGDDAPQITLREPELSAYGQDIEPVKSAPADETGVKEWAENLKRWRERLPALSEAHEAARDSFAEAVLADAPLAEELRSLDMRLRAEFREVVVRRDPPR